MIKSPIFLGSFKQVFIDKWKYGGNFYYRENMKVKFLLLKYITTKFFQNQVGATAPTVPNLDPSLVRTVERLVGPFENQTISRWDRVG